MESEWEIIFDDKAKDFLVEKGFQPEMGARPLRRTIEQYMEDPLAEQILLHPDQKMSFIVSAEGDHLILIEKKDDQLIENVASESNHV